MKRYRVTRVRWPQVPGLGRAQLRRAKSNLATSLERMGLDYMDFYLLRNVGGERDPLQVRACGMWDFALDAKERGSSRHRLSAATGPPTLDAL